MATNSNNRAEHINTVLIVEDNDEHMNYNTYMLKRLGFTTVTANSGEDALKLLNDHQIDCLLLDINLGKGMSGLVLMETIRGILQSLLSQRILVVECMISSWKRDFQIF